jgi:arylamine N-acetyltransferase
MTGASNSHFDAYFLRIGYFGERTPTLETLQTITRLHPQAIPFENRDLGVMFKRRSALRKGT